jgi:hypothetical protein
MRSTYFIIRILLVVLILAVIINFLLVFSPFSTKETEKEKAGQRIEELQPENESHILNEDEAEEQDSHGKADDKDIIGYSNSETDEAEAGSESYINESLYKDKEYFLTYDEIVSVENISFSDKLLGLSVLSKLGKTGLEKILRIADGGVTIEEWSLLNSILDQYLGNKDIERLKELIIKNKKIYKENMLARK